MCVERGCQCYVIVCEAWVTLGATPGATLLQGASPPTVTLRVCRMAPHLARLFSHARHSLPIVLVTRADVEKKLAEGSVRLLVDVRSHAEVVRSRPLSDDMLTIDSDANWEAFACWNHCGDHSSR